MKTFITIIITLLVSAGIVWGIWYQRSKESDSDATLVRIEPVATGELVEIVNAPGVVFPKMEVAIAARVSARITELPFKEGDRVTKGDPTANPPVPPSVLIRLDSKDLEAQLRAVEARAASQEAQIEMARNQLESNKADVAALRAELTDAQRELDRQKSLYESKDVSQQAVDQAQTKVDLLQARLDSSVHSVAAAESALRSMEHQLDAAQAEIVKATDNLGYTTIVSPIDGVVTHMNRRVGELVVIGTMNNPGTVIVDLADFSEMLVKARVDETSIAGVEKGQKARVKVQAYEKEDFEGLVESVALAHTDEKDGAKYFKVEVLLKNNGKQVLSGLTADVDIETKRHENVVRIPSQSVLGKKVDDLPAAVRDAPQVDKDRALAPIVYRVVDEKAIVTPVQVGPSDLTHTAILSGLTEGDQIITGPYKVFEKLEHEKKVKDEKTATTQPAKDLAIAKTNGQTAAAR